MATTYQIMSYFRLSYKIVSDDPTSRIFVVGTAVEAKPQEKLRK